MSKEGQLGFSEVERSMVKRETKREIPVGDGGGSALGGAGGIAPTVLWEARQNSGAPSLSIGAAAAHSLAAVVLSERWENGGGVN